MGDSDEEVDKRNVREKFKHERSDYDRHDGRKSHDASDRYRCYMFSRGRCTLRNFGKVYSAEFHLWKIFAE